MSSMTKRFFVIKGRRCITPHYILPWQDQDKMGRITTMTNITQMVENLNVLALPGRNCFDKPSINKSVDSDRFVVERSKPIAILIDESSPQPTPRFGVHFDFGKYLGSLIGTYIEN